MDRSFLIIFGIALVAALASPLRGALAIWLSPSSLLLSIAVGLAGGVLLGTFAFEMMPKALELASPALGRRHAAVAGLRNAVYVVDLTRLVAARQQA